MSESLHDAMLDRLTALRREQKKRWWSGDCIEVEKLLERDPELKLDEKSVLDLIYNEMRLATHLGRQPTLDIYQQRFPTLGGKLAQLFEVHDVLVAFQHTRSFEAIGFSSSSRVPLELPPGVQERLDQFDAQWRSGPPPRIEDFRGDDALGAPVRQRLSMELVALDMEYRWRAVARQFSGDSHSADAASPTAGDAAGPLLEEYLARFPELGPSDRPCAELIVEEYWTRTRYAKAPDVNEYTVRFPGYGKEIGELLSALEGSLHLPALGDTSQSETSQKLSNPSHDTSPHMGTDPGSHSSARPGTDVPDSEAPLPYSDFRFEREIGSGGMGTVYRAVQVSLAKPVAVKVLKRDRVGSPAAVGRFLREGRSVARLRHPHIVDIHGIGRTPDGGFFMVMDLVDGEDLSKLIQAGSLSMNDVFLVAAVAHVIEHAHQNGVIHRDLKPSNILIDQDGQVLVSDFGLAKLIRADDPEISMPEELLGTPSYMAPEQANPRWGQVGPRTDVYGLGGLLYAILTGQPPFMAPSFTEVLAQVISAEAPLPPSQLRSDVPPDLEHVCLTCLSKNPAERFATAREVAEALGRCAASLGLEGFQDKIPSRHVRLAQLADSAPSEEPPSGSFDPARSSGPPRGAMPLDSAFYLERTADREFQSALARHDSIILIRGARQMGKTSLLARGMMQVRRAGARVVLTDFQKLRNEELQSPDHLFVTISEWMVDELDLDADPADQWDSRRSASVNFERFIRRDVLKKSDSPLVWGLDEVDRLFECPFRSEIFGLFRSWHNARALQPTGPWSKLSLAMAYATEAHLFITDPNQSPFNVGTLIAMEDFSREQVANLNARYGSPLDDAGETDRFCAIVGGHPYLVSQGLYEMAVHSLDIDDFESQVDQDAGFFGDHLRRLLALLAGEEELRQALRELLRGVPLKSVETFYRLRSAGFIAGDSAATARPRCRLYESYFQRHLT